MTLVSCATWAVASGLAFGRLGGWVFVSGCWRLYGMVAEARASGHRRRSEEYEEFQRTCASSV